MLSQLKKQSHLINCCSGQPQLLLEHSLWGSVGQPAEHSHVDVSLGLLQGREPMRCKGAMLPAWLTGFHALGRPAFSSRLPVYTMHTSHA
jgi:hypothetical protein